MDTKTADNTPEPANDVSAFWATPEPLRQSFVRGKHAGRAIVTGTALAVIGAAVGFVSMPVWGVSLLGGVAASIALSNGIGYAMDRDNSCQLELGKATIDKPALKTPKDFFRQGLKNGLVKTLNRLPLAIVGTPFWPALLAAGLLVNKGTRGYYLFPKKDKSADAQIPPPPGANMEPESTLASQPPLQAPFKTAATADKPAADSNGQTPPAPVSTQLPPPSAF